MNNSKLVQTVAPTEEPIDLTEARLHLKLSSTAEDSLITGFIKTARQIIERYLNRALITQTWELYMDCWEPIIEIPFGNLSSNGFKIEYRDATGTLVTLQSDQYWVVTTADPGYVKRAYTTVFPVLQLGRPDAIKITFTCGYGSAANVPQPIKDAMKLWIGDLYENRGTVAIGPGLTIGKIPNYIQDLIHSYKLYEF